MDRFPTVLLPTSQTLVRPIGTHHKPGKGYSESQFERDLCRYFPGKIQAGLMLPRLHPAQPYVPDLAYVEPENNLFLAIEIDEPYSHVSRQPLHFLHCSKDLQRNQYFLACGWGMIRFSEKQVMTQPQSCCKTIASTLANLTGDSSLMTPFRAVPTLKPEQRWSEAQAQAWALSDYRHSYAPSTGDPLDPPSSAKKRRRSARPTAQGPIQSSQFSFYCPVCGEGPIRWQGHYVCCPNCQYDGFAL